MLDTSILIAILVEEEGYGQYVSILSEAKEILIGAPTLAEAGIVLQNLKRDGGLRDLLLLLERWGVRVVDFTRLHCLEAIDAHRRYGKGRHPARLNLGDCNSYATAKVAGAALVYKGNDFALTDLPKL